MPFPFAAGCGAAYADATGTPVAPVASADQRPSGAGAPSCSLPLTGSGSHDELVNTLSALWLGRLHEKQKNLGEA